MSGKAYVYVHPQAPAEVKDLFAEHFSDVTRVSAVFMQEATGGLEDDGPAMSEYAAVLLDEAARSISSCQLSRPEK